ncbi:Nramp family divalent metal transporter [Haliea sp. E1-2-M8]|uniref:Nramp family divalent metal transporter n=1 Tax=Haliea sp. E1-2-M8 TaxID=3064706 RepID=UPI0027238923|nr:Nramp family divalent metal transporter [Haliea sp. E1-2-M8]MDO8862167.1 Nramp family divalent metal transporter [Haliea sp. E1-2-M8]
MNTAGSPRRSRFGPGLLVTAAFIGPGTITTASSAGAHFGFALLWALLFSVAATLVLQEMSARLGLVTREGLAEAMRAHFRSPLFGKFAVLLIVAAVGFGNAAYEAGNIAGAALALNNIINPGDGFWAVVIGGSAALLLASGRYRLLEGTLILLVLTMSIVFLLTAAMVAPAAKDLLLGLLRPTLPEGSVMVVIALVGTTVVPYNLFLHANAVREKWSADIPVDQAIRESRLDSGLSIGLGGLITLAIMSTAAAAFFSTGLAFEGGSLARQLEPLLGPAARYVFAAGLFAGGFTSAITAPLAAAYAVCGALGWRNNLSAPGFRLVWVTVLLTGTLFAALGTRPLTAILFAQMANGLLLPVVAVFLLLVMNSRTLLGQHTNGVGANLLGAIVVAVAVGLGVVKLLGVAGWL